MTTAAMPDTILSIPAVSPLGKAIQQVMAMEVVRDRKIPRWKDVQAFVAPYSTQIDPTDRNYERNADNVIETSIFFARTTLASFFSSAMTNPSRVWSEWTFPNPRLKESKPAKQFLHDLNERRRILHSGSNFYATMDWVYEEWPTFSTAVVLIEEDEEDVFRYVPFPVGSYALADDAKGRCVCVSRRFEMTVRQVVERFATNADGTVDRSKLSTRVQNLIDARQYEQVIEVAHLVCPNNDFNPVKQTQESFRFASLYWEWGNASTEQPNGGFLAKEGYREWPFMVFRWKRIAGDPFGVDGPGFATLADVKSMQQMESDKLMGVEKLVRPPTVSPTDAGFISIMPGANNKVNTRTGQTVGTLHDVLPVGIQLVGDEIDRTKERMFQSWYTRLVLALTATEGEGGRERTATEITAIGQEKFLVLGRAVESAAIPFRDASNREYAIMARRGFIPEVPPDLENEELVIQYLSMLAIAMRSVGLSGLREYGMLTAEMARLTGDKEVLRRTDWSEWAQEVGDHYGISPKVQRSDEEVDKIRRAEQEAAQQQVEAEQAALEAKAVKDLATAPTDTQSALTAMQDGIVQGRV